MAEFTEEFEPLFDYSRVQPFNVVCLDDEDDDNDHEVYVAKKMKVSQPVVETGKTGVKEAPVVEIDESDDDWLPSPPKVYGDAQRQIEEDSTLKELRLKKQELVSFAQSAQHVLHIAEESAKRELSNSLQPSMDGMNEKTSKDSKPPERAKILISVQDKDEVKQFRVYMDDKFERIIKLYADKLRCDPNQIALSFDGDKINSSDTPASLGLEDNDIIEVHVKSR